MLDQPLQNKMMTAPPAKKGFHFASDGIHFAEFIEAETIEDAEAIYHTVKRVMSPAVAPIEAAVPDQQSTTQEKMEEASGS